MELFFHYLGMPYLLEGVVFTLEVTALGLLGGFVVGLALAAMQLSRYRLLSGLARTYAVVFRGTPLILQLVFAYDALPHIGLRLSSVMAAALALSANEGPFLAEIFRSGVLGVDRGQVAAGQALGMTPWVLMRRIIAPQAIRTMIPGLGNEAVSAMKNSSLASVIAVEELTLRSTQLASSTFDFFSIFFASGVVYLALTGALSLLQLAAEAALDLDRAKPGDLFARMLPWRRDPPNRAVKPAGYMLDEPTSMTVTAVDRSRRADILSNAPWGIEVGNLRKAYGDSPVLDGLSLTVRSGEVVALLGRSGAGKSTLLRCINLLEEWDAGTVRVGGKRLGFSEDGRKLSPRAIANERANVGVGMVFQQFNLFQHLTAQENIAGPLRWVYGLSPASADARAMELLHRVGLAHRSNALPRHLSGGQQQRVAIARALAPKPSVLLLDEPTSALDPEMIGEVLDVIKRLAYEDGLTMIISTHQLRFARELADRVIFLSGGTITEEGDAEEVLTRPRHPTTARFLSVMGAHSVTEAIA